MLGGSRLSNSSFNTHVGTPIRQPIPFSHNHHAYELGIDCRFCHASVEKAAFAGIPSTQTCMTCHSQIWTNSEALKPVRDSWETGKALEWERVNWVPDFVYFNHSIHINRGINCNTCHGPVQKMPITWKGKQFAMAWCLKCHEAPEKYLYSQAKDPNVSPQDDAAHSLHDQAFNLYWKYQEGGIESLSKREQALILGNEYKPTQEEVDQGVALVNKLKVSSKQLQDCWICHR